MTEPGLYLVMKLVAGVAGLIATSPLGEGAVPDTPLLDMSPSATSGYLVSLEGPAGASLGEIRSSAPLRKGLEDFPDVFLNAVIAAEDKRFLENPGVDPFGTASAVLDRLRGRFRGGSGIAQQMVKNTIVGSDTTMSRKAIEAMLAVRLVDHIGRQEVLSRYLQSAWFGRGVTGAALAPHVWFGKDWDEVNAAEAATLAAMLKGPARYDPYRFPERVKRRRDSILSSMENEGWLSPEEAAAARNTPVEAIADPDREPEDSWIASAVRADIADEKVSVPARATAIVTIDPDWQDLAERSLQDHVRKLSPVMKPMNIGSDRLADIKASISVALATGETPSLERGLEIGLPHKSPYRSTLLLGRNESGWDVLTAWGLNRDVDLLNPHSDWTPSPGDVIAATPVRNGSDGGELHVRLNTLVEGAVIAMDPRNGEIIASVGGVDSGLSSFDRTRALRSPGSAIKPFLYLAALEQGLGPEMGLEDREETYRSNGVPWRPRNYDRRQLGVMPMYTALERSSNLVAARLANMIGIASMAEMAEAAGAYPEGEMGLFLPSSLGASSTRPVDLVSGFAAIINDATPRIPHVISSVTPEDGAERKTRFSSGRGPIANPEAAGSLVRMLRGVIERGTARVALSDHAVTFVGKTGTSQEHRDAWFVAVTPHIAIGVWLGRDDNKPLPARMAGGTHAAPIVGDILTNALAAGLIDGDGYRDRLMTSGMPWPPAPFGSSVQAASRHPQATSQRSHGPGSDGFWGVVSDQRSGPDPDKARYDANPVDRNADLLDFNW